MPQRSGLLLLILLWPGVVTADADGSLRSAVALYQQAQTETDRETRLAAFQRAEQLFAQAIESVPANAKLYANQGTASLQAERLGKAVLAYRRALSIDPDNARASRNLNHARELLPAWLPRPNEDAFDSFFFWRNSWSGSEQAVAAAVCFLLAAIGFAIGIRWQLSAARQLALLPLAAWIGLIASLSLDAVRGGQQMAAVVTVDGTVARAADSINAPARFAQPLPEGTEVEIVELRDRWAKVTLADNQQAWLNRSSLERVKK